MIKTIQFDSITKYTEKIIYSIMEKYNYTHIYNKNIMNNTNSKTWYVESIIENNIEQLKLICNTFKINDELVNTELVTIPLILFDILGLNDTKLYINNKELENNLELLDIDYNIDNNEFFKITKNNNVLCTGYKNPLNTYLEIDINKLIDYVVIREDNTLDVLIKNDDEKIYSLALAQALRMSGFKTDIDYLNNNINSKFIIELNKQNIENDTLTIINNKTKKIINKDDVIDYLDKFIEEEEHE